MKLKNRKGIQNECLFVYSGVLRDFVWKFVWKMGEKHFIFGKKPLKKVKIVLLKKFREALNNKGETKFLLDFSIGRGDKIRT